MKIDGLTLLEGSSITNTVVAHGPSFPVGPDNTPDPGELFFKTDNVDTLGAMGLWFFDGTIWQMVADTTTVGSGGTTTIEVGASFPGSPVSLQLFYKTDNVDLAGAAGLYYYDSTWIAVSSSTLDWSAVTSTPTTIAGYSITDAYTKTEVDNKTWAYSAITSTPTTLSGYGITDGFSTSGGTVNGNIIIPTSYNISIADAPAIDTAAANKAYVDSKVAGLTWKNSVVAATAANITLSGTQTIDNVAVVANDRVLVKNQSSASANGIYIVAAGAWTRTTDFDSLSPIDEINSAAVFVEQGTTYADTGWTVTSNVVTLDTDAIIFAQFNGASGVTAGIGLTKVGNTLSVQLGAGIAELPTNEVGVEVHTNGGLITTVDGTTPSTTTGATLAIKLDGTTLSVGTNGLKVNSITTSEITGLGTLAVQDAGTVAITGGAIDSTAIGTTTKAAGAFTELSFSGKLSLGTANYGTAGQMLTSGGAGAAPTWADAPASNAVTYDQGLSSSTTLVTSATTANQVISSLAAATYRSVEYFIQATSGTDYHTTKLTVIHDGTNTWVSEYGTVFTNVSLATFSAQISGGNIQLITTPVNAVTTYKVIVNAINI